MSRRSKRVVWWVLGVLAAALGVWLYVRSPGTGTYWVSGVLMLPLTVAVLGVLERRLPVRVQWVGAVLLAVGGAVGYAVWPNAEWWHFGALAALPLVVLVAKRGASGSEDGAPSLGGFTDGPWGPP